MSIKEIVIWTLFILVLLVPIHIFPSLMAAFAGFGVGVLGFFFTKYAIERIGGLWEKDCENND